MAGERDGRPDATPGSQGRALRDGARARDARHRDLRAPRDGSPEAAHARRGVRRRVRARESSATARRSSSSARATSSSFRRSPSTGSRASRTISSSGSSSTGPEGGEASMAGLRDRRPMTGAHEASRGLLVGGARFRGGASARGARSGHPRSGAPPAPAFSKRRGGALRGLLTRAVPGFPISAITLGHVVLAASEAALVETPRARARARPAVRDLGPALSASLSRVERRGARPGPRRLFRERLREPGGARESSSA